MVQRIFVYGSLKPGGWAHNRIQDKVENPKPGAIRGDLFNVNNQFPALKLGSDKRSTTSASSRLRFKRITLARRVGSIGFVNTRAGGRTLLMSSMLRALSKAIRRARKCFTSSRECSATAAAQVSARAASARARRSPATDAQAEQRARWASISLSRAGGRARSW